MILEKKKKSNCRHKTMRISDIQSKKGTVNPPSLSSNETGNVSVLEEIKVYKVDTKEHVIISLV